MLEGERRQPCFKVFPNQCEGCPEYSEFRHDPTLQLALQTATVGIPLPAKYTKQITKECKRYHKRIIEYA